MIDVPTESSRGAPSASLSESRARASCSFSDYPAEGTTPQSDDWLSFVRKKLHNAVAGSRPLSALDEPFTMDRGRWRKPSLPHSHAHTDGSVVKLRLSQGDTVTCLAICDEPQHDAEEEAITPAYVAAGSINKLVRVYDSRTGVQVRTFLASSPIASVALSRVHARTKLVIGTFNGRVMCFDMAQASTEPEADILCFSGEPLSAIKLSKSLSPSSAPSDGELMAVGGQVHEVLLYKLSVDCTRGNSPALLEQLDRIPFSSMIRDIALDHKGQLLAIAGDAKCVTLWALESLQEFENCGGAKEVERNAADLRQNLKRRRVARLLWKAMRMHGILRHQSARKLLHVFHTKSAVHSIAFTDDGGKLAIGTAEHNTMVWQLTRDKDGGLRTEPLLAIAQSVREGSVAFSGDGERLAVGSGNMVQVINMLSGATVSTFKRDSRMRSAVLSQSGSHLFVGGFDKCVSIYKVDEGARQFRFRDVLKDVIALAATDHGGDDILVVGGARTPSASTRNSGVTVVFHIASGDAIARWERAKAVYALALTRNGAQCAVGAYDNQVIVHDVATGAEQQIYSYESSVGPAFIWSCSFSASGDRLAVGCWNHKAYVYANLCVHDEDSDPESDDEELDGLGGTLLMERDLQGRLKFISRDSYDESHRKRGLRLPVERRPQPEAYAEFTRTDRVYAANLTHDGERLLVGGRDKRVVMYQVYPVKKLWSHTAKDVVYSATLSKDSSICAIGGPMDHVNVLDCEDGAVLHVVQLSEMAHSVRMMASGTTLLVAGEQLLAVLNIQTGAAELMMQLKESAKCSLATQHSLVVGAGSSALMYGKASHHFGWREPPSFSFVSSLLKSDEYAKLCLTPLVRAHPLLVNTLQPDSGKTLLQFAIESSGDEELLETLLSPAPEVSMTRDLNGYTSLHIAIALGRRKAVRLLLTAVTDGRVSLIPDSLEPIIGLFKVISRKYPAEFLHFLSLMPLDEERQVLLESEREAHLQSMKIRGSELRAPVLLGDRSFWADYFPHVHGGENKDGRGSRYSVSKRRSSRYSMHRLSHMANLENFSKSSLPHWANGLLTPMVEAASEESNESVGRVPVHALRVPFNKFAGFYDSVEMSPLFLILQASDLTGDRRAFSSPVVSVLIQFKWQEYGKNLFIFQFGIFLLYICVNTSFSWLYVKSLQSSEDTSPDRPPPGLIGVLWITFAFFVLYLLFLEVMQALHQPLWTTLRNPWNWMQYYSIITQIILCVLLPWSWLHSTTRNDSTTDLLGHQLALSYFRIIYFLRGFTVFGPLVRMIQQIMTDVLPFLVILFIALFGFAMGLGIVLYDNNGDFGSPLQSVMSVFNYGMIGELNDFDSAFIRPCRGSLDGSCFVRDYAALVMYFVMMILVQIVSLNLLIAIMSDSYRLVRRNSVLESAYEKAYLLLQLETTWLPALAWLRNVPTSKDLTKFPRWLHVLKPVKDGLDERVEQHVDLSMAPSMPPTTASGYQSRTKTTQPPSSIDPADVLAIKARLRPLDKLQASVRRLESGLQLINERASGDERRPVTHRDSSCASVTARNSRCSNMFSSRAFASPTISPCASLSAAAHEVTPSAVQQMPHRLITTRNCTSIPGSPRENKEAQGACSFIAESTTSEGDRSGSGKGGSVPSLSKGCTASSVASGNSQELTPRGDDGSGDTERSGSSQRIDSNSTSSRSAKRQVHSLMSKFGGFHGPHAHGPGKT